MFVSIETTKFLFTLQARQFTYIVLQISYRVCVYIYIYIYISEVYSEPYQTSKMELFAKIGNGYDPFKAYSRVG